MINEVRTYFIHGRNDELEPTVRLFNTIILPTPTTVTATAKLSMVSLGGTPSEGGLAGAVIWKGGTDTLDLSKNWDHNGGKFFGCVFITFALSLRLAFAAGQFTLYIHA
jgi:hypothetical protein